jgi:nicotinate-nucleotide pyrophosphorylase (carboxylating)
MNNKLPSAIIQNVTNALIEDIGSGDITAQLIPEDHQSLARIISRERAIIAGHQWVNEVFKQVDPSVQVIWKIKEGEWVRPNQVLFELIGPARSLLTGERAALNFLQTLSGTATTCRHYYDMVNHTGVTLLDTRKTLPGLRLAQKYAVTVGRCANHRIGLYDAFLIKENHILACGGINKAVVKARDIAPNKPVEVEVESLYELEEALRAKVDIVMLDNFSLNDMCQAVTFTEKRAKLEASGNITSKTLLNYAQTGVDYISIGALTKDCQSIDLSMKLIY